MWQQFKTWINKPYNLIDDINIKLSMIFGVGIFTYLFLCIFQPYGIHKIIVTNHWLIAGYGILVSFCLFISYFLIPKIFPHYFNVQLWTIKKEISFLFITFLIISTFNYFYHNYFVANYLTEFSYFKFIFLVLSIAIFPVALIIFIVERYFYKKNIQVTNTPISLDTQVQEFVTIPSDNIKEKPLTLAVDDILFAQSNNNYTTIVFVKNSKIQQELIRITLKKLETFLTDYPQLIRCHRSFLINKKQILRTEGNMRSLKIKLKHTDHVIPVSRTFSREQLSI